MKNNDKKRNKETTDSNDRMWELLMRTYNRKSFRDDVKKLRKKFDIPEESFKDILTEPDIRYDLFQFPEFWLKHIGIKRFDEFLKQIDELSDKYKLGILKSYPYIFYWIIFYAKCILPDTVGNVVVKDMVITKRKIKYSNLSENYYYPVALLISAHATGREIKDYINTHWNRIKTIQNRYIKKAPLTQTIRRREPLNITKFIYSLDGKKTPKEIAESTNKEFDTNRYNNDDITRKLDKKRKKER